MKSVAVALSLLVASSVSALAQSQMSWTFTETENGGELAFGVPDSDNAPLSFVCAKGNATVLVSSRIGSKGLKADEAARIVLTVGKVKKEFAGKAIASQGSAIDVDAGASFADVKAALTGGKALTLEVKGMKQQVSLDGAPDAYASFEAACK